MLKSKSATYSILLFIATVIGSSLFYMLYDFMNNDVAPNVKVFGASQLVLTLIAIIFFTVSVIKSKSFFMWGFYIACGLISFIQIPPAFFWIAFNGKVVAETSLDKGVMGHWIYGVLHIIVIAWGILNIVSYRKNHRTDAILVSSYIPLLVIVSIFIGLFIGTIFNNILIFILASVGVGGLMGVLLKIIRKSKSYPQA